MDQRIYISNEFLVDVAAINHKTMDGPLGFCGEAAKHSDKDCGL